jgi:hypothetical protein
VCGGAGGARYFEEGLTGEQSRAEPCVFEEGLTGEHSPGEQVNTVQGVCSKRGEHIPVQPKKNLVNRNANFNFRLGEHKQFEYD